MITKDCWKGECNKFYYTSLRLIMELHHNTYTCIDLLCKTWAGTPSLQLISTALSMLLTSSSSSAMISPNFFYNKAIEKIKYRDIYIYIGGKNVQTKYTYFQSILFPFSAFKLSIWGEDFSNMSLCARF